MSFVFPPRQSTYVKAFKWQKFHACFPRISWLSPDNFLRVAARRGSLLYLNCFSTTFMIKSIIWFYFHTFTMKIQNLSVGENLRLVGWWRSNSFHLQTLRLQLFFTAWLKETFENTSHWVAIVYVRYHKIWETSCKRLYNKKRKRLKSPMDFQHHFPLPTRGYGFNVAANTNPVIAYDLYWKGAKKYCIEGLKRSRFLFINFLLSGANGLKRMLNRM